MAKPGAAEPIAIIGSSCHFAGDVSSPSDLWTLLQEPRDVRQEIPNSRFSTRGFYHKHHAHPGHTNVKFGYLLNEDLGVFDADFFGIKPVEAKAIDPQQRWLMESVYEAIESAGLTIQALRGSDTGVYVGVMSGDYEAMLLRDLQATPTYFATGTARSILSNRLSHFFDWRGPSVTIDTACSSSLVAMHMAVQALRAGDSHVAVACGSNLILGPENYIIESKLKMLSPDGISRMWDQDANGYARGDGVAVVVLKTLSAAIADGDHIECIIRETGINQDGATPGITVPSTVAQQALIRRTYLRAGLDIWKPEDRPQFFEAHGTGTPAGDPVEAEAIHQAFFGSRVNAKAGQPEGVPTENELPPLFVGSIKTVIGHSEGAAGLAGVLKASLALQNNAIPPNLHFNHLADKVAPFYKNLELVRGSVKPWPALRGAQSPCRRASVNSFGFGGANAHAILESYCASDISPTEGEVPLFTPFVFSAASEDSLRANLREFSNFLDQRPLVNAHDLAWTLRQRRSTFAHRTFFTAGTIGLLQEQILSHLKDDTQSVGVRSQRHGSSGGLLGVFTGQGAQFARLGAELVESSPRARSIILNLEEHLNALPSGDRPQWSLMTELTAPSASTRIAEAAIAQPLCTAVQILLVDLLSLADIHFDAVVGHSSGEIAAAYAAGFLSARDAMLIAYFRGVYVSRAASPNGAHIRGSMLAAGTSMEDAEELCSDEVYAGRLSIAACNSSSSVTISGDTDAIEELEILLEDEKKFHRRLRVDTAYHSRHMDQCYAPYVEALRRSGVQALKPSNRHESRHCQWYSSVYDCAIDLGEGMKLNDKYWAENMTRPVLFSQALKKALLSTGDKGLGVALEIGPHPALQGPAQQTIQESLGKRIPYQSTLVRGKDSISEFANCLGFLWQHLWRENMAVPSLDNFERAMVADGQQEQKRKQLRFDVVKGLPSYQWNHTTRHWAESRASRMMRLRGDAYHPLLGHKTPDSSKHHLRWRNLLRLNADDKEEDILHLKGHRVQGQTVFPAAGYIAAAVEAARALPAVASDAMQKTGSKVCLIEIRNMVVHQAITLASERNDGVEVLIELTGIAALPKTDRVRACFSFSAALGHNDELTQAASAQIEIVLGEDDSNTELLPPRQPLASHLVPVEKERFYTSLASLGYEYDGTFRSLTELKRKHGHASCLVKLNAADSLDEICSGDDVDDEAPLLLHPASLDSAFQSLLLAYSYPGDHQLRTLHLPLSIECIRVNPALCGTSLQGLKSGAKKDASSECENETWFPVEATITRPDENGHTLPSLSSPHGGFNGDITLFTSESPHAAVQVHNVHLFPLGRAATEEEDRKIFLRTQWVDMAPDGLAAVLADRPTAVSQKERDQLHGLKRLAVYYYRQFDSQVARDSPLRLASASGATAYFLDYAQHVLTSLPGDWPLDTPETIEEVTRVCEGLPDVGVMHLVGQTMPRVFRGETTMLEAFRESGVLDDYYVHSFSSEPAGRWQARVVDQIATRHPNLNMLEIGAGTGGTTKPILNMLGDRFQTYTFTDVSAGFFSAAATALSPFQDRLTFKTLDIEADPRSQGFAEGAYDLIVASFVLHATASLSRTLANVRKLLRPGGFLVVGEGSVKTTPISSFIFGPLPGWWLGRDDGRLLSPHASTADWDRLLRENGFSGIDARAPDEWEDVLGDCLFASQAVDGRIRFLRAPLSASVSQSGHKSRRIAIVGGQEAHTGQLVAKVCAALKPHAEDIQVFPTLASVDYANIEASQSPVLSLADLDKPVFKDMTEDGFAHFQRMFKDSKTLLWVTAGRQFDEPFSNMVVGFGRTAVHETPGLNLQHLDLADPHMDVDDMARTIAASFLRFIKQPTQVSEEDRILWTVEPEILVDAKGRLRAARLEPIQTLNDRYNSGHRPITREVDIASVPVAVVKDEQSETIALERLTRQHFDSSPGPEADGIHHCCQNLRITHAVTPAIRTPLGPKFLALGVDSQSGSPHLTLMSSLASSVNPSTQCTLPFTSNSHGKDAKALSTVASHLVALSILDILLPGQTVVVHNATAGIAEAIYTQANEKGVEVVFISDHNTSLPLEIKCATLPRYLSQASLWNTVPSKDKISCFVTLGSLGSCSANRDMIMASLPSWCRVETTDTLFSSRGGAGDTTLAIPLLEKFLNRAALHQECCGHEITPRTVELAQLVGKKELRDTESVAERVEQHDESEGDALTVVDFTTNTRLPARVRRLDAGRKLFRPDKTYWVIGLSGDLGISLCDWMINTGSKHLVLTSRKPNIEQAWMDAHRCNGVNIDIIPCDITDYEALVAVHTGICTTHPPIAGVFNGAMVLRDTSIRNMTFAHLNDVVRPKVMGSLNLDRIFGAGSPLDFFVLFSSTNFIIGNQGQANYAAANAFQCALAESRRKRGLAGSAANIGAIIGAGYIQRSTNYKRVLDLTITRGNMMHLSEEDFHQIIAEAIETGRPGGDGISELTTGLLEVEHDAALQPLWFSNPKFAHLVVRRNRPNNLVAGPGSSENINNPAVVQERLGACRSSMEVTQVITEAFAAQLRQELQISGREDTELMEMRSNEIGLDSLVSVDIRSWFLKTLKVSIPVLRIMSNDTMASLVQLAVESRSKSTDTRPQPSSEPRTPPTSVSTLDSPTFSSSKVDADDNIDWESETRPPVFDADLAQQIQSTPGNKPSPARPPQNIVITGTTGLLGSHLLNHVLRILPANGKAICIGLRRLPTSHQDPRVVFRAGDFTLPRLGLSASDCMSIFATADAVIHVGADTSHLKPYAVLREANVGSTRELARLCLPRGIPLHYVSTVGVGFFSGEPELRPERASGEPGLGSEGYTTSKWVCEQMLERLGESTGLPIWIHRPSAILRLGEDNEGERAQMDWLNGLLRYVRKLQAVPEVKHNKGALDMVYAGSVCNSILQCVVDGPTSGAAAQGVKKGVSYVHQVGDIVIPLDRMDRILELDLGPKVSSNLSARTCRLLPMEDWIARARGEGLHPAVLELIESMDQPDKPGFPVLVKS